MKELKRLPYYKDTVLEDFQNEIWREIKGYETSYSISNFGRVRSEKRYTRTKKLINAKILKQTVGKNGEPTLRLSTDNVVTTQRPIDLVGKAFMPDKKEGEVYTHKNKVKTDNMLYNIIITSVSKSHKLNFKLGVSYSAISDRNKKAMENRNNEFCVYDEGELIAQICATCMVEKEISNFYFRNDNGLYRRECIECFAIHDGTVDVGKYKISKEMANAGLRKCSSCKKIKSLDNDFHNSPKLFMGKSYSCKECVKIKNDHFRMTNPRPKKEKKPEL